MFKYCRISFFLVRFVLCAFLLLVGGGLFIFSGVSVVVRNYLVFDSISFYLILLILLLGLYSQLSFFMSLSFSVQWFLFLSIFFSIMCFCSNHSILFWCFYELSMLPLLFLIFKDSPYSERFLAGWYFACYLLITRLPLILLLLYLSAVKNSCFFSDWSAGVINI